MPTLVFEHDGRQRVGSLTGRVLIGRRLSHGVVIADPAVSRLHAWIDNREGIFVLTDAGSRTGTFVNGNAIVRYELQHGDTIQIGPATVRYLDDSTQPPGAPTEAEPLDLTPTAVTVNSSRQGILWDCACGAPLWVAAKYAGRRGLCKYCGEPVRVPRLAPTTRPAAPPSDRTAQPQPPPQPPPLADAPAAAEPPLDLLAAPEPGEPLAAADPNEPVAVAVAEADPSIAVQPPPRRQRPPAPSASCGVCHSAIEFGEERTVCPDCGTRFHTDCWMENYGCSTYGCPQVNALKPASVVQAEAESAAAAEAAAEAIEPDELPAAPGISTEAIVICSAVIAALLGALAFGVFSAAVAVVTVWLMLRHKPGRRYGLLTLALLLALLGIVLDLGISDFWWLAGQNLPIWL